MKFLLLWLAAALLDSGLCELALPPPLNPTVTSVNFKHELRWTEAPGSPSGLRYHFKVRSSEKRAKVNSTTNLRAEVILEEPTATYTPYVRSSFKRAKSPWSKGKNFTPYLNTNITAPNVTLAGCGKCIQVNITLPKAHRKSGIKDISKIYKRLLYKVSWRQKQEESVESIETENQTVVIPHLFQGTEYCVQVLPMYLDLNTFEPSPWECVFTGTVQPSQVFAIVGSVAAAIIVILSVLVLLFFGLQYTGIICKVKEVLPHTLSASSQLRCPLRPEKTVPETLLILPESGRQQHSPSDQEEEELETNELDQMENQEEGLYMDRGADLSSDSSSKCSRITSSFLSAAPVMNQPGSQNIIEIQPEEQTQVVKNQDWIKTDSKDCVEIEEWHKELEMFGSVNLFSVTTTALNLQPDQEPDDVQPLQRTPEPSDIVIVDQQQLVLEDDSEDQDSQMNYYMRH